MLNTSGAADLIRQEERKSPAWKGGGSMANMSMLTSNRKVGGGAHTLGRFLSEGEGCHVRTTRVQAVVVVVKSQR